MKYSSFFFSFLFAVQNLYASNDLVVRVPDIYLSYPGYIDKATLVIEPHGGYSEQSLYLEYSDHNQFSRGQNVEVIHRFELPQGAVVNDLWLWIGDSVMQAIMLDTWTARSIYDSIVSMKRDPAFLTKKGNQYELHIYPLEPGNFRKIKMNFITPTKWIGNKSFVELPLQMLKSNNNTLKPLDLLYRVKEDIWGKPEIKELPSNQFTNLTDTVGSKYLSTKIVDISELSSFNLSFNIDLLNGLYFDSELNKDSLKYFQLSIMLRDLFNLQPDSSSKKVFVGVDLSGQFNKNYEVLIPRLKNVMRSALKPADYFKFMIAGAGEIQMFMGNWVPAQNENIDQTFSAFLASPLSDSIAVRKKVRLLYADHNAAICWNFRDIELFASADTSFYLYEARNYFHNADIIASYDQGLETVPNQQELPYIISALDSFFLAGGRFLTYFDYNRDGRENIATHYIDGLRTKLRKQENVTLYRNLEGNIGADFPEEIDHAGTYFLNYDDPSVRVELRDADGNPAVISKKIGNGIIVVSGLWSFNDDEPLRKMLALPLLGLSNPGTNRSQITELLENIKSECLAEPFDKVLLFSNSDSLFLEQKANNWADAYWAQFGINQPVINSVNLIDGIAPSSTVDGTVYYGSGYLEKRISDISRGLHFETYLNDWEYISSVLSENSLPPLEQFSIESSADGDPQLVKDFRQIIQLPQDINSPIFYIGSTGEHANDINFSINAKFRGIDSLTEKSFIYPLSNDTMRTSNIISTMLGNEKIKDLFSVYPADTAQIVSLALNHNILCDFTALLALEPNDTIHFLTDPLDESVLVSPVAEEPIDTLEVSVYPNPFNSQTRIMVKTAFPSSVTIYVYNILGQKVKTLTEAEDISGLKIYSWDATDSHNVSVSSGVYLLRTALKGNGKEHINVHKLLLIK